MGASFDRTTLRENPNFLQEATGSWQKGHYMQYLVVFGVCISSISSALGSLFGGSRIVTEMQRNVVRPFRAQIGCAKVKDGNNGIYIEVNVEMEKYFRE